MHEMEMQQHTASSTRIGKTPLTAAIILLSFADTATNVVLLLPWHKALLFLIAFLHQLVTSSGSPLAA